MAVEFFSQYEKSILEEALCFKDPDPSRRPENPYDDGMVSFFLDPYKQKFPTGLLGHVLGYLGHKGIIPHMEVVKAPQKESLEVDPEICDGMVLRDYQIEAVRDAIRGGRGLITAPPRSGKTLIQAAVAKTLNRKSVLFVQRTALLEQHVKSFREWGLDPGIVQGSTQDFHKQHTIAMFQTVWSGIQSQKMKDWLASIDVMQVDECHHAQSATMYACGLECEASWRLGYSGTPFSITDTHNKKFNEDTWRLIGLFGPPIVDISLTRLQNMGLVVPVNVVQVSHRDPDISHISGTDWFAVYDAGVAENDLRNRKIIEIATALLESSYLPLILVQRVEHGNKLFDMLSAAGIAPLFAKGGKQIRERHGDGSSWSAGSISDCYQKLRSGHGQIMIATSIGDEGVDLPEVDALILAVGGKADQVTTQRIFRPLTAAHGKHRALVIDFDDKQHPTLKKHSALRRRIYRLIGFEPRILSDRELLAEIKAQ